MLYDPKKWEPKIDLSRPSLRGLSYLLRHKELWPVGFEWDFGNCDRCAMGLAFSIWNLGELGGSYSMTEHFPISEKTSGELFLLRHSAIVITPEMIADRIDALT